MAVFKCKMCGGSLEIISGQSVAVCEYCGTKQTLPKLDDEKRIQLYDRANYFRRENEFDKAMGIYEMILGENKTDAEAYWGIVLCRYGIEYVEDPHSHKRIPTVNRAQFVSIFDDPDYLSAVAYADAVQKEVYKAEAAAIDDLQKGILEISSKEDPFDVFICYKESDDQGNRTQDSVYAQDIYDALTKEGYKVFFSRITLEDKLGSAFEPYIFAALNSAKVMLVVGSQQAHFNAVWVKNEWSRYLNLIKAGKDKTLIPVYKNISPYDMPEEFQYLQSQDMGKVGYLQDLVRGIKKIIDVGTITVTHTVETTSVIVDTMLKRGNDAMSQFDWQKAERCFDNVLDYDEKNAQAFIGKLLVNLKLPSLEVLQAGTIPITGNAYYQYLCHNADEKTVKQLKAIEEEINTRIQEIKDAAAAKKKAKAKKTAKVIFTLIAVIVLGVSAYFAVTEYFIPNSTYQEAVKLMEAGSYNEAASTFQSLAEFKDSKEMVHEVRYQEACAHMNAGRLQEAADAFVSAGLSEMGYKDSKDLENECYFQMAMAQFESGDYVGAAEAFRLISDYPQAEEQRLECMYLIAAQSYEARDWNTAIQTYRDLGSYKDSAELVNTITYEAAKTFYDEGKYEEAITYFQQISEYEDSAKQVKICNYKIAKKLYNDGKYVDAVGYFEKADDYKDSKDLIKEAKYKYCTKTKSKPTDTTKTYIKELKKLKYKESASLYTTIFKWKAKVDIKVSLRIGSMTGVSFDAKLSGGDGTSTKVKFVIKVDGQTFNYCDDKKYKEGDTPSCQLTNSMQDITKKKYTVKVYDGKGKLIGSASGKPKG